jgi:hypothetical protein
MLTMVCWTPSCVLCGILDLLASNGYAGSSQPIVGLMSSLRTCCLLSLFARTYGDFFVLELASKLEVCAAER